MATVEFDSVDKVYPDGFQAIFDLNLHIEDGEFMILVGPSGCGKSTALRMVAGLEDITSGQLLIGDKVVNDLTPKQRDIAMVFQSYALYPHMTVFDNMAFALKLAKVDKSEIEERVTKAAEILELKEHLERKPKALSGGQRQRVAMGRAIVRDPTAFLMDEPLSNLDAKLRVQMRAEIASLQRELGVTTVYVTHDQVEAMTMGDRVAVLKRGRLMQADAPQHLYDNPDNLFVAGFIGSPAMNLAECEIGDDGGGRPTVILGDGRQVVVADEALDRYPKVKDRIGDRVAVGMRPEHFVPGDEVPEDERWGGREVKLVEQLGAEMLVHFQTPLRPIITEDMREAMDDADAFSELEAHADQGQEFVARFEPGNPPKIGDQIAVGFRSEYLHFFDIESGDALN